MSKMKKIKLYTLLYFSVIALSTVGQNLSAVDYQKKLAELPNAPIVDVRTPDEFNQSRLKNAVNINIADESFPSQISKLDKSKPVFVYCLTGSRSSYASRYMLSQGFKVVYDLTGGIMRWRSAGLSEITGKTLAKAEMTQTQFNDLLNTDKLVLLDFYADWCAPCKKMAPSLSEIQNEMGAKVEVVKINADQNKTLVKSLNVSALPTLMLYKNKKLIWTNSGYLSKEEIVNRLVK